MNMQKSTNNFHKMKLTTIFQKNDYFHLQPNESFS